MPHGAMGLLRQRCLHALNDYSGALGPTVALVLWLFCTCMQQYGKAPSILTTQLWLDRSAPAACGMPRCVCKGNGRFSTGNLQVLLILSFSRHPGRSTAMIGQAHVCCGTIQPMSRAALKNERPCCVEPKSGAWDQFLLLRTCRCALIYGGTFTISLWSPLRLLNNGTPY
jgi:hypothetical protein